MTSSASEQFRALHIPGNPLILPNPWDAGSARILEGLGFKALATTSSGFALTKGRQDYGVTRASVIDHCADIVEAVTIPVTADLENGFGADPADCAKTIELAIGAGLAGGSIEDSTGDLDQPVFDVDHAADRIAATVEAIRKSGQAFVLTARAEAFLYGDADLNAVIDRLLRFEACGADVLYAPGLPDLAAVREVCQAVSKPVNVLIHGALVNEPVAAFADAGVARLSLGGSLAWSAYGSLADAASILQRGNFSSLKTSEQASAIVERSLK